MQFVKSIANTFYTLHGDSPLHNLNLIQFGNLPDDSFLICLRHTSTCGMSQDMSGNMRHILRLPSFPLRPFPFFLIVGLYNIPQDEIDGAWHHGRTLLLLKMKSERPPNFNVQGILSWKFSLRWVSKASPTILFMEITQIPACVFDKVLWKLQPPRNF